MTENNKGREIKFRRAYFTDDGTFSHFSVWGVGIGDTVFITPSNNNYAESFVDQQFTGLLDKDGKEIFEGDVLSFTTFDRNDSDTQWKGCVVWCNGEWSIWKKPTNNFYGSDGGFHLGHVHIQDDEIEILGNIFEQPVLLEER